MAKRMNKLCKYFHSTDLYDCPHCKIKLRDFEKELAQKVAEVPIALKQRFIDNLKTMNVGDSIKEVDPEKKFEFIVWTQVLSNQIITHSYETLDTVVKE